MFLDITLDELQVFKSKDKPLRDIFDSRMELYQTWQMSEMSGLEGEVKRGRQGYSSTGAMDSAVRMGKGESRQVGDPRVTHQLPDDSAVQFDIHYWESDGRGSTTAVRTAFSDQTLKQLQTAWEDATEEMRDARKDVSSWLDDNAESILKAGAAALLPPGAVGIAATYNLLPFLNTVVKLARRNADDYHGHSRFVIQTRGQNEWRVIAPSEHSQWMTGDGTLIFNDTVRNGDGSIDYRAGFIFRGYE